MKKNKSLIWSAIFWLVSALVLTLNLNLTRLEAEEVIIYPDEVLVVVNDNYYDRDGSGRSDSVDVGEYYAQARGIPEKNICHISCPMSEDIEKTELSSITDQVKNYLDTTLVGPIPLKKKIYYIVTTLGVPLRYRYKFPWQPQYDYFNPIDLEIANIYYGGLSPSYFYQTWYYSSSTLLSPPRRFKSWESQNRNTGQEPVYLATRLDGPTLEIAKNLVDKALYAEKHVEPFSGTTYIDRWGLYNELFEYFDNLTSAFIPAGISVTQIQDLYPDAPYYPGTASNPAPWPRHLNRDYAPGDCPETMYYWGWYKHWSKPTLDWKVGGLGAELQSYTAASIRSRRQDVPIQLHSGVTATMGFVDEPGAHDFGKALNYFVLQGLDFAESIYLAIGSSKTCGVGDPLYNLYRYSKQTDTVAPKISNIQVDIDERGLHFSCQTDELAYVKIEWGLESSYGQILEDKFNLMNRNDKYSPKYYSKRHGIDPFHIFVISQGLLPNTTYHYRVRAEDPAGNVTLSPDQTFITPADTNFSGLTWSPEIAVWGYQPIINLAKPGKTVRNFFESKKFFQGGNYLRFHLQASSDTPLRISDASIAEAESGDFIYYQYNSQIQLYEPQYFSEYLNLKESTKKSITFNSGNNQVYLNPGESVWSDWVEIPIDVNKRYCLGFFVDPNDSGLTYTCYGQTTTGWRTFDAQSWSYTGNISLVSNWTELINQETQTYQAQGNFTQPPNYSLERPWGDYQIYGIDAIEVKGGFNPNPEGYSISGRIMETGVGPLKDVTVSFSGSYSPVTTNANGQFYQNGFALGSYTVTPAKTNYIFNPSVQAVNLTSQSAYNINFTAQHVTNAISGRIADSGGQGVKDVEVKFEGIWGWLYGFAFTDDNGDFVKDSLPNNTTFRITPSKPGFHFEPIFQEATIYNTSVTGVYFTGGPDYYIEGNIYDPEFGPLKDVIVSFSGGYGSVITNAEGHYRQYGFANGTYIVTPAKAGYSFLPTSLPVEINNANSTFNIFAGYRPYYINGKVTKSGGGGLAGVEVSVGIGYTPVSTNTGGYYTKTNLQGTYLVRPSKPGWSFQPVSQTKNITSGNISNVNFTGQQPGYSISGKVTESGGGGLENVIVSFSSGHGETTTKVDGTYQQHSFPGNSTYRVTPAKPGYIFTPKYIDVDIGNSNRTDINFTATHIQVELPEPRLEP